MKVMVCLPNGKVHIRQFPMQLASCLQAKPHQITSEAETSIRHAWAKAQQMLKRYRVAPENTLKLATEGLRATGDSGRQLATELGIQIIPWQTEARLLFYSVMAGQKHPRDKAMVVEIGGGSVEWAFKNARDNRCFSFGTIRNGSHSPYDYAALQRFRLAVRADMTFPWSISKSLKMRHQVRDMILFVKPNPTLWQAFNTLYQTDLFETRVTRQELERLLTRQGLNKLQGLKDQPHAKPGKKVYYSESLPVQLVVLVETMRAMNIYTLRFGSPGGLKAGAMYDWINRGGGGDGSLSRRRRACH